MPCLLHLARQRLGQARPVDRLDGVEQAHRLLDLVGLERADEVEAEIGVALPERRIFGLRLLHAVLAEEALAGIERRGGGACGVGFRHGDERDSAGIAPGRECCGGDARLDRAEIRGDGAAEHRGVIRRRRSFDWHSKIVARGHGKVTHRAKHCLCRALTGVVLSRLSQGRLK